MIENLASNMMKKKGGEEIVELYYDFQKAYDNVNHAFLEKLLEVYGFTPGVQMLIIEMMARWKIRLSYGAKKEVGEVRLENGIIQGDAFSPLLFVLMIDPLIKIIKTKLGERAEVLYYMDDLKVSMTSVETAKKVHETVKKYAEAVGMVINNKKSAIQLNVETPLPQSLQDIPRMDETTYKYLGFEMIKGEVDRKGMMAKLEVRIREKLEEPMTMVEVFETRNWIHFINQNIMSVVRFYSGPVKFTLGWLDRMDKTIRQHLTQQGMLMKRGMATSRLYMKPDDMGMGLKSCVAVYLIELVRLLLQYKWGTIFRQEWFWRMEELTKKNGKGIWMREIEKVLKRFGAPLEWLFERIGMRDQEIEKIKADRQMEERAKEETVRAIKTRSIGEVLEEMEVLVDTHFDEFSETKSSLFLKKGISNQSVIETTLLKKTWRTLNCTPRTMKVIREIQENLLCVGKRNALITKKSAETVCFCSKTGRALNAKHIISCCRKVSGEISARHDIVVNILLNNILIQRKLVTGEQKWEDRKMVRTPTDEITIGTEHWRSDEWREKCRVAGAKLKPDLVWLRRDSGDQWKKVVVDVKITSTDKMNEAFKEKDEKYREWATRET